MRPAAVVLFRHLLVASCCALPPALAQDAEKATHGDEAATPQLSFEHKQGDFVLRQYQLGCLSQLTYLLGSGGEAVVVDPQRDVEHYLRDAAALGLRITKVVLTHTNADFVAGHTELHARAGATILISGESHSEFPHQALKDGDQVPLGSARLEFWATPGHTLDSMSVLVRLPGAGPDPAFLLTGDTLFIGGIGRPDLVGGDVTPTLLASKAYDAMQRIAALPDGTRILPAHGAGSLCGAHLSPQTVATLGDEKRTNPFLRPQGRAAFVSHVLSGLPVAPQYFRYNVALNRTGPPVVEPASTLPPALAPVDVAARMAAGAWVVDLRDSRTYAAGHVRGSLNVGVRGRLDTWIGIVVPFEAELILVGSDAEVQEAAFRLRRIGRDRVVGYVQGGVAAWQAAGQPVAQTRLVAPRDLAAQIAARSEPIVVDVRGAAEFAEARIGDYVNLPVTDSVEFGRVLDRNQDVLLLCNSAYRSSLAVGLAERQGFTRLANLDGGLDAWLSAGLPAVGTAPVCQSPAAAAPSARGAGAGPVLAEALEPQALARGLMDQPDTYVVLDVRPAWQFAEYHVPGAENVAPQALTARLRSAARGARVVLVDRDGSVAAGLAGWVLCELGDAAPALRVLSGGTARFWREIELQRGGPALPTPALPIPAVTPPAPPASAPAATVKKRNAGC